MEHSNLSQGNLVADEVNVDLDVLRVKMVDRISGHIGNTNIVTVHDGCRTHGAVASGRQGARAEDRHGAVTGGSHGVGAAWEGERSGGGCTGVRVSRAWKRSRVIVGKSQCSRGRERKERKRKVTI